jgi:hypothetical protein
MKTKIDLSKLKIGDKVKLRNGDVVYLVIKNSENLRFKYMFSNNEWYTITGNYDLYEHDHYLDIVKILNGNQKPKSDFDFTTLPEGCTEIVIDQVRYKKKVKTIVTWEQI